MTALPLSMNFCDFFPMAYDSQGRPFVFHSMRYAQGKCYNEAEHLKQGLRVKVIQ